MKINKTYLAIGLILLAFVSRLLPHPANFTPLMAVALFSGAVFSQKKWFFLVPVTALFLSDLILGFHSLSILVYLCFALVGCMGLYLDQAKNKFNLKNMFSWARSSVLAAVLFFVISNLGVFFTSGAYAFTGEGLAECFALAIPFFHNTLLSTLVYSLALFTGYSLVQQKEWSATTVPPAY